MKKFRVIAVIMVLALVMCSCGADKKPYTNKQPDH
jgi:PBP1b-binding outer membrane lipoprotein LpoB